jgi:hypothetical protein
MFETGARTSRNGSCFGSAKMNAAPCGSCGSGFATLCTVLLSIDHKERWFFKSKFLFDFKMDSQLSTSVGNPDDFVRIQNRILTYRK